MYILPMIKKKIYLPYLAHSWHEAMLVFFYFLDVQLSFFFMLHYFLIDNIFLWLKIQKLYKGVQWVPGWLSR